MQKTNPPARLKRSRRRTIKHFQQLHLLLKRQEILSSPSLLYQKRSIIKYWTIFLMLQSQQTLYLLAIMDIQQTQLLDLDVILFNIFLFF
jgi:hypothetical protein